MASICGTHRNRIVIAQAYPGNIALRYAGESDNHESSIMLFPPANRFLLHDSSSRQFSIKEREA